jgi:hypothetical protein
MDKVQRRVFGIYQWLGVQGLKIDNFEPLRTANAYFCLQEVDRARLCGNVELLYNKFTNEFRIEIPVSVVLP